MSELDKFLSRAAQIAKEEGLLDGHPDKPSRILPDPRETEMNLTKVQRVMERLAREKHNTEPQAPAFTPPRLSPIPTQHDSLEPAGTAPNAAEPDRSASIKAEIVVKEQMEFLSKWYDINAGAAKKDRTRYWVLKIPALLSTVSVSALESFGYGKAVIVLGVVAAFCVGIDAAFPGGQLHNIHRKAANEILRLQHEVITKWRQAQLGPDEGLVSAAQSILKDIQVARERIDTYVTEAEASLGKAGHVEAANKLGSRANGS